MEYCKLEDGVITVYSDSVLSSDLEELQVANGWKVVRVDEVCPWKILVL